jgi:mannose-6-phosphate isomerase-like protein (cupin superfamily)
MINSPENSTPNSNKNEDRSPFRLSGASEVGQFERAGFDGRVMVSRDSGLGFETLEITVHGDHPRKRMLPGTTRSYFVIEGMGSFTLGGTDGDHTYDVEEGDTFVIPAGGEYAYTGIMILHELNVSPDGSFKDEKLE